MPDPSTYLLPLVRKILIRDNEKYQIMQLSIILSKCCNFFYCHRYGRIFKYSAYANKCRGTFGVRLRREGFYS